MQSLRKSISGLVAFAVALLCCACAPKLMEVVSSDGDSAIEAEDLTMVCRFAGDAGDHLVFELDVENASEKHINIRADRISLVIEDPALTRPREIAAIPKRDLLQILDEEKIQVRQDKKAHGIISAVQIGLGVLSMAVDPGGSRVDQALYTADASIGLIEGQRSFSLVEGSLDDQIQYVDEWVLDSTSISPDRSQSWDVLFPDLDLEGPATLIVEHSDANWEFEFFLRLIEH